MSTTKKQQCRWHLQGLAKLQIVLVLTTEPMPSLTTTCSLRHRSGAACAAVVLRMLTRSLTRPVSRTVRLSTGDSGSAPGLFCVDADTSPYRSEDAKPGSARMYICGCVLPCVCACTGPPGRRPGRVGRAGLPCVCGCTRPSWRRPRQLGRASLPGAFWCASPFLLPLSFSFGPL